MTTSSDQQQGSIAGILLAVMTVAFVGAGVFAAWAYSSYNSLQTDYDVQLADDTTTAVAAAVKEAEADFLEREKNPFRSYSGTDTYGALTFEFPKFWNVYREGGRQTILDFYAHPREVPGTDDSINFAFRTQILDETYTSQLSDFESSVEKGDVTIRAFEPELVPSEAGVYITGEVVDGKQGAMVLLPQRDKTFKFWTEAEEYVADFDAVVKTINYSP